MANFHLIFIETGSETQILSYSPCLQCLLKTQSLERFNKLNWMSVGKLQTGPRIQAAVVFYRTQIYILGGNDEYVVSTSNKEL